MTCQAEAKRKRTRILVATLVVIGCHGSIASAQVTINGGLGWSGGYGTGGSSAQLRTNAAGATPPPFTLFTVDSRVTPSPGGEVRVGVSITPRVAIEGGALFSRPRLGFSIAGDREAAAQEFEGESLQHYVFDAALLWNVPVIHRPKFRTFAIGGGGYVRELHQDRTLVESGQIYYLGGGARYWVRGGAESNRSIGLRGDVRINMRRNGIDFDNESRIYPTISVLMFVAL
jgi:hypothetical protein